MRVILLLAVCAGAAAEGPAAAPTTRQVQARPEYLVGVYYFSGWWREQPNKYYTAGHDWRPDYPGRAASLGEYNEAAAMEREIAAAAKYGVGFFQFLWYPIADKPAEPHAKNLNTGPMLFMAAKNAPLLRFTVEYVNHAPFQLATDAEWEAACRLWCDWMKHPSYLHVGNRPVFKIHDFRQFLQQNGGKPQQVATRIETLRRIAQQHGAGDPLVGGGIAGNDVPRGADAAPYDFLTTYMDFPAMPPTATPYPYERLIRYAASMWSREATQGERPYVPYVPAGWDPRPWKDPRPPFEFPTREQWIDALQQAKTALDGSERLGIPLPGGGRQKMLLIYAWNEFAEGVIVAPTKGDTTMKLEGIRQVFQPGALQR